MRNQSDWSKLNFNANIVLHGNHVDWQLCSCVSKRGVQLVIPKVRYSEGSLFRSCFNPKVRYSEGSLFRNSLFQTFAIRKTKSGLLFRRFVSPKTKSGSLFRRFTNHYSENDTVWWTSGITNLRNDETKVRINEPYFVFGLMNSQI